MARNLIKIAFLFIAAYQMVQLSEANPPKLPTAAEEEASSASMSDENANLTPTDPLELTKMAFRPLTELYGTVGPLIFTLLTEENALGNQIAVVSKLIVDEIGLKKYSRDMNLIISNLLTDEVKKKVLGIYDQIKDIAVQNDTTRTLENAVEIITNVLNDEKAVAEIDKIIKTTPV